MRSLIVAFLLCLPVLLCPVSTPTLAQGSLLVPAKTTTKVEKDLKGLKEYEVVEYFGRKPYRNYDDDKRYPIWTYKGKFYDVDAKTYYSECAIHFSSHAAHGGTDKEPVVRACGFSE